MALQISDPSCESWYLNTVTSSRLHSSFATEPCGRHCQLVLFPWQSISLRYNFWTDFCFWAMIAGTLLGMYSEFLSHGSLRNVGLPFSEVCIQYAFLPPKRNLIVDLCGSATIDMAAPSTHAAMITKNLSMLTASALSSAQYPAISCSSWPAIPSNDREWNSVRTSSGRCSSRPNRLAQLISAETVLQVLTLRLPWPWPKMLHYRLNLLSCSADLGCCALCAALLCHATRVCFALSSLVCCKKQPRITEHRWLCLRLLGLA